tara:strand:- start:194 stop:586 length:393 start_codon:yes stop_codon:yes gene_type:complete
MKKEIIKTPLAPAPIGPYNQAIKVNDTLYVSGQIGLDPKTMAFVNESIEKETEQVMQNLSAVLKAAQMSFEDVVKTTIFLDNMSHFQKVNAVYGSYFDENIAPARETVAVKTLPKNVKVEISVIAIASNN